MEDMTFMSIGSIELFFLILARVSAIFIITPVFGSRNLPTLLKAALAFVLSVLLLNTVDVLPVMHQGFGGFAVLVAVEMAVGFLIGFVAHAVFSALYIAGQVIDMETGLGIVNVLDHQSNMQVPITGNLLNIVALLVFLTLDGHHMLISAVHHSFELVPPGGDLIWQETALELTSVVGRTLIIAFKISAPVVAAIFMADIGLGILSRAMPQMNVFVIGIPIKILVGMIAMTMLLPVFSSILENLFVYLQESIFKVLTKVR
jgi:flagellar biosynthetic protein FliR